MSSHHCPRCGNPVDSESTLGLCPRCLLEAASGTDSRPEIVVTQAPPRRTESPTLEQLAPHFPGLALESLIAVGGMGAVYKATQKSLGRPVALKILHAEIAGEPGFAERFQREARTLASLSHPGLVAVHDFGQAGPFFYFVMEFVDGASLRQMIRAKSVEPTAALTLVMQICEVLQYAHDHGVVHRDIKPENILVDRSGRVKILDFGLSKVVGAEPKSPLLTRSGQVMGTPHYMAPEQWERPLEVDHRADIYALGVVFYELLTGELPLGRFAPPSRKVEIDVRLDEVVLRTLDKEPALRYQHASDVRDDVDHISKAAPALPSSPEAPTPAPPPLRSPAPVPPALQSPAPARASPPPLASKPRSADSGAPRPKPIERRERLPGPMLLLITCYLLAVLVMAVALLSTF
jgi:serine/threonine protein kinase